MHISSSILPSSKIKAGIYCSVIYHDANSIYKGGTSLEFKTSFYSELQPLNYIIYAGRVRSKYKNIHSLLLAFRNIISNNKSIKLVIVHSDSFNNDDEELVKKLDSSLISIRRYFLKTSFTFPVSSEPT